MHDLKKMELYLQDIDPGTEINIRPVSCDMFDKLQIRAEQQAFIGNDLRTAMAPMVYYSTNVLAMYWKDELLFICGIRPIWNGVGDYWMSVDNNFKKRFKEAPQTFIRVIRFWINNIQKYTRLQTPVLKGFKEGYRFALMTGFEEEGLMRKYSPSGDDYYMFAAVKKDR